MISAMDSSRAASSTAGLVVRVPIRVRYFSFESIGSHTWIVWKYVCSIDGTFKLFAISTDKTWDVTSPAKVDGGPPVDPLGDSEREVRRFTKDCRSTVELLVESESGDGGP